MKIILCFLVGLLINAFSENSADRNYELSICAIFQNEAPYFKEWIEFHKLQGVEHFFLYNNNSTDDYLNVLEPYIESGDVTIVDWPYRYEQGETNRWLAVQCGAYINCIELYGDATDWLAVVDIDEFLFCPNGEKLPALLKDYQDYGGLCAYCLVFGTSYVAKVPDNRLMIEVLTLCNPISHHNNSSMKSIVQPKYVQSSSNVHLFNYKEGYFSVDVDGNKLGFTDLRHASYDKIRINHYWTRTEDHFYARKVKSRNNRRTEETVSVLEQQSHTYNNDADIVIRQFVPALRKQMGYD